MTIFMLGTLMSSRTLKLSRDDFMMKSCWNYWNPISFSFTLTNLASQPRNNTNSCSYSQLKFLLLAYVFSSVPENHHEKTPYFAPLQTYRGFPDNYFAWLYIVTFWEFHMYIWDVDLRLQTDISQRSRHFSSTIFIEAL